MIVLQWLAIVYMAIGLAIYGVTLTLIVAVAIVDSTASIQWRNVLILFPWLVFAWPHTIWYFSRR